MLEPYLHKKFSFQISVSYCRKYVTVIKKTVLFSGLLSKLMQVTGAWLI